ncbi:contactin-2 isoform X1 [Drosophila bipectinata]|uniref:contactin-2 isoform X1 n=2 Tax=Drosophila bipectinata TaxID=42026 RepID=UPI0038B39D3A
MSSTSSSVLALSSFNLLFFTQVLTVLSSTIKYNEYATDKGGNVSIPCIAQTNIMWVKEHGNNSTIVQTGRVLVLRNVSIADSGIYVCFASLPRLSTTPVTRASVKPATSATTSSAAKKEDGQGDRDGGKESPKDLEQEEMEYQAFQRTRLTVRTVPGPVTQLYFKASTILGFLIWRFNKTQSGGYPVRSFTAEFRNVSYSSPPANSTFEHAWSRMDPINIAPNVRQMEVYRLAPNTTYEFRIWANNELGSGEVVTTNVTTLPETKEEELQDGWDSIELIPNIILNPGFSESDGAGEPGAEREDAEGEDEGEEEEEVIDQAPPLVFPRTILFSPPQGHQLQNAHATAAHLHHSHYPHYPNRRQNYNPHHRRRDEEEEEYEEEQEPTIERFKRKVSVFFTGPTIKRI